MLGFGVGTTIPTMVRAVAERVEPHRAGLVGGVVNSTLQVSAALGVAVLGGLFFVALGAHRDQAAIAHAFAITLLGVATAHAIGGLPRSRPHSPPRAATGRGSRPGVRGGARLR